MLNANITEADLPARYQPFFLNGKAKLVTIPANFPLWKLSSYMGSESTVGDIGPQTQDELTTPGKRKFITPWWANINPFGEDQLGARHRFKQAKAKGRRFQDEVRIANAVRIDWNGLSHYQEVVLTEPCRAFWGQFEPVNTKLTYKVLRDENATAKPEHQKSTAQLTMALNRANNALAELRKICPDMPDMLGGVPDAWQFYIPNLSKYDLQEQATIDVHDKQLIELMLNAAAAY